MSEQQAGPVDQMKEWARRAPPPNGRIPDGDLAAHLRAERLVVILMDSNGHAYHINNVALSGAHLTRLDDPRTSMNLLMDAMGVGNGPNWGHLRD